MDPLTIGAAASALIGGIGSIIGGTSANRTNLKINREQIAYDREKMASQMAWEEKMWNAENAYNTPSKQRERLEAAGINPYFALTNMSPGMAQSAGAAPSGGAPAMQPVQPVDYGALGRGIADVTAMYYNVRNQQALERKTNAEAAAQETHNKYLELRNILELQKLKEDKSLTYTQNKWMSENLYQLREQHEWNNIRNMSEAQQAVHMARLVEEQVTGQELQNKILQFDIDIQPYKIGIMESQIAQAASAIAANYASANASNTQADVNREIKKQTIKITEGLKLDNEQKEKLQPIIEQQLRNSVRQQGQDYWNPFRYVGTLLGGATPAAINALAK